MTDHDPDGSQLLTSTEVGELLGAAVEHAGGRLIGWALDHVDANPNQSTTATYSATVAWPYGERDELLGVSARASGPAASDTKAEIFADGEREVAVWIYPNDPDLPGLARAAYTEQMAGILTEHDVLGRPVAADEVSLRMIGYRPRRRAVLRVDVEPEPVVLYCKVLRERLFGDVVRRHELLLAAGVPAPRIAAVPAIDPVRRTTAARSLARLEAQFVGGRLQQRPDLAWLDPGHAQPPMIRPTASPTA